MLIDTLPFLENDGAVFFTGLSKAYSLSANEDAYLGSAFGRHGGDAVYDFVSAGAGPKTIFNAFVDSINIKKHYNNTLKEFRDAAFRRAAIGLRSLECWPDACAIYTAKHNFTGRMGYVHPSSSIVPGFWLATAWSSLPVPDKAAFINYVDAYTRYLPYFKTLSRVRVLEICSGCKEGASALYWMSSYFEAFFEHTIIDVDVYCGLTAKVSKVICVADDQKTEYLANITAEKGPFNFIIDSGGCSPMQQISSLSVMFPSSLAQEGVYFIEGVHSSRDSPMGAPNTIAHALDISDVIVARGGSHSNVPLQSRLDGISSSARAVARGARHISFYPDLVVIAKA